MYLIMALALSIEVKAGLSFELTGSREKVNNTSGVSPNA